MNIIINDLNDNKTLTAEEMQQVAGGWFDYNPYYSLAYNSGYYGWGNWGYQPTYSYGSMGSWLQRQGSIDAGHDAFISYLRS
jgi:hypothetical protein